MWFVVDELLQQGARELFTSSWIPSHLDSRLCESPFEDWIAKHNGIVDALAVRCNQQRSGQFQQLLAFQKQWDQRHTTLMDSLRGYYFEVFERSREALPRTSLTIMVDSSDDESERQLYSFSDHVQFDLDPDHFVQTLGYSVAFLDSLFRWLRTNEEDDRAVGSVSLWEITAGLLLVPPVLCFPHRNPMDGSWHLRNRHLLFERPTMSCFYGIVQKTFRYLCRHWCDGEPMCHGLNRSHMGITIPLDGISLRLRSTTLASIQASLCDFTKASPSCSRPALISTAAAAVRWERGKLSGITWIIPGSRRQI